MSLEGEYTTNGTTLHASDLPNLDGSTYKTSIAKHFQGGRWLYDKGELLNDVEKWAGRFTDLTRQSIAVSLLRAQGWVVFIRSDKTTKEECDPAPTGSNNNGARRWIDNMCFETLVFLEDTGHYVGYADSENSDIKEKFIAWQEADYGGLVIEDL